MPNSMPDAAAELADDAFLDALGEHIQRKLHRAADELSHAIIVDVMTALLRPELLFPHLPAEVPAQGLVTE